MPDVTLTSGNDNWSTSAAGAYRVYGLAGNDRIRILTSSFAAGDAGDLLDGGDGDDYLYAGYQNDTLLGGPGADQLFGRDGNDTLDGGDGNDTLDGGNGDDVLNGGPGDDTLLGGFGDDQLNGGDGNDMIVTSLGTHIVDGGAGDDKIYASNGNDNLTGGDGNDEINGGGGNDIMLGNAGDDQLFGTAGDDFLDGGAGNDLLNGGENVDTASYISATAGVTVDLSLTTAQDTGGAGIDTLAGIEYLEGSNFNDQLRGDATNNLIRGLAGNDLLFGGDGNDGLLGGDGDDILDGGNGADQMDGGNGVDVADYSNSTAAVTINLRDGQPESGGFAQGDTIMFVVNGAEIRSIEKIYGSAFDDTLVGDDVAIQLEGRGGNDAITGGAGNDGLFGGDGNDTISGNGGNDTIVGDAGDDILNGGDGNDILQGGSGADQIDGGNGVDIVYYVDSTAAVTVNLGDGAPESGGFAQGDVLSNIENILGSAFNDVLIGDDGVNTIFGNSGNDIIRGGGGRDSLYATTSTTQTTAADTFDYNSITELEAATLSNVGAWDTIFGFTPGGSTVVGRDFIDLHDLFAAQGLSFTSGSAAFAGGYWGIVGVNIGGVASIGLYVDINGGSGFGDGGEYWVAGLYNVSSTSGFSTGQVIV